MLYVYFYDFINKPAFQVFFKCHLKCTVTRDTTILNPKRNYFQ